MLCFYFVVTVSFNVLNVFVPCASSMCSFHAQHHGMTIEIYSAFVRVKKFVEDMK